MDTRDKILLTENNGIQYLLHLKEDKIIHVERKETEEYPLGTVLLGRVMSIKKELSAAFVSLGKNKAGEEIMGFLPISKVKTRIKKCGDLIPVQVKVLSSGFKNCELTEDICLVGRYAVVSFGSGRIHYSPRLKKESAKRIEITRETLENTAFFKDNMCLDAVDISVRTNAEFASPEKIMEEVVDLSSQLLGIDRKSQLSNEAGAEFIPDFIIGYLNGLPENSYEAVTENPVLHRELAAKGYPCRLYHDPKISLKRLYAVDTKLKELLSPKVYLKSGGFLMIEKTEALVSVDINSGQMERAEDKESFFTRVNLEACDEIFRQIQVRNLSGILIIDFINMKKQENIDAVVKKLEDLFRKDTVKSEVSEFTKLGLAECTRQKKGHSLEQVLRDYIFA